MNTNIIDIGNSKGIRLPKTMLQQCSIKDGVNLTIKGKQIILTPIKKEVRKNWQRDFQKMRENQDDKLLLDSVPYDDKNWQW